MTEIFCVQNILFLKPQHIHFGKNTCTIKWIIIVLFWKMPCIMYIACNYWLNNHYYASTDDTKWFDEISPSFLLLWVSFAFLSFRISGCSWKKKLIIVTQWNWTSHTITVNLFLSFLTHFSLSFTFLTYETFLTRVNQQQCFYP